MQVANRPAFYPNGVAAAQVAFALPQILIRRLSAQYKNQGIYRNFSMLRLGRRLLTWQNPVSMVRADLTGVGSRIRCISRALDDQRRAK
jgi:hypothetical protein